MSAAHLVHIDTDGTIRAIHDDDITAMLDPHQRRTTARASHVEPVGSDWIIDLSPLLPDRAGRPLRRYARRDTALRVERAIIDHALAAGRGKTRP